MIETNRRILACYVVVLFTLLAAVAIKSQSLGFGTQVLEARNQTVITTGVRPVANTGCTCGQPRPVRACGSHCGGGGIITVP